MRGIISLGNDLCTIQEYFLAVSELAQFALDKRIVHARLVETYYFVAAFGNLLVKEPHLLSHLVSLVDGRKFDLHGLALCLLLLFNGGTRSLYSEKAAIGRARISASHTMIGVHGLIIIGNLR